MNAERKIIMVEMDSASLVAVYLAADTLLKMHSACGWGPPRHSMLPDGLLELEEELLRHGIADPMKHIQEAQGEKRS